MHRFPAGARRALPVGLSLFALAVPSAALAHGTDAGAANDHRAADSVATDPATERLMTRQTRAATADDARAAAAAIPGSRGDIGEWGPLHNWDVFGIHVALMTDGKVLAYDTVANKERPDRPTESYEVHDSTRAMVYDPATGSQARNDVQGFNLFCTGLAHLGDGTVFLAGGNKNRHFEGLTKTATFRGGMWAMGQDMVTERWYPTVTAMANGEMLITAGQPRVERDESSSPGVPDTPEVRTTSGAIRQLPGATRNAGVKREEYPWTQVAPNGDAFIAGPEPRMRSIDTDGTGRLTDLGEREPNVANARLRLRDYGSHAMYDIGKILISGGARPALRTAVTIDLNGEAPRVTPTRPMAEERRQHNLTVLADGSVLATGGHSGWEELVDLRPEAAKYAAERWDPATGQWKTLAAASQARQYHSTALLLPDGRVLNAGGGICGRCSDPTVNYAAKDAQIFSPPYLFDERGDPAARPVISAAPDTLTYDTALPIATPQASSIRKVAMIRLGAVTHSVDMGQRYVPLEFTRGAGTVNATTPRNANIAPPGPYMLVVVDAQGVPSVAKMVNIGAAPSVQLTAPASGSGYTSPATAVLEAAAADADGAVSRVEFFSGATKLGEDTTAPYSFGWTGIPAGTYPVTARATDDSGRSADSATATITVSDPPPPPRPPTPPQPPVYPPLPPTPPVVQPTEPGSRTGTGTVANPRAKVVLPSRVTIRGRTVAVKVSCARACRGTLRIQTLSGATRGRVAFRLTKAGTRTLRVAVDSRTRSLARRKPQRLRAAMVVQAGSKQFTARRTFTLRVR